MRRLGPILCLWLATLVMPAAAAPLAHREVLPNGIVLLVAERPTIPIVVVRLYTRAGSVYDPLDAGGLANLTADMLTRGTAKHTAPELDRAIEFVGGSLEGDAGRDGATVSLSVLKKDLRLGLDLLGRWCSPRRSPRPSSSVGARRSRPTSSAPSKTRAPWRPVSWPSSSTRGIHTAGPWRARSSP